MIVKHGSVFHVTCQTLYMFGIAFGLPRVNKLTVRPKRGFIITLLVATPRRIVSVMITDMYK